MAGLNLQDIIKIIVHIFVNVETILYICIRGKVAYCSLSIYDTNTNLKRRLYDNTYRYNVQDLS